MKVGFDSLIRQTCKAYNDIVETLNEAMKAPSHEDDEMVVYGYDVREKLDRMRACLVGLVSTHIEGNKEFKDLYEKIELKYFYPEDDE